MRVRLRCLLARPARVAPRPWARLGAAATLVAAFAGCTRGEPPAPDVSPSVALPDSVAPDGPPRAGTAGAGNSATGSDASVSNMAAGDAGAIDSASLPQTHDRPSASGPAFEARVAALWSAIVADDPQQAMPFFFPVAAYRQVKDVPDPAADWRHRLVAAYVHDIHALHRRLGDDASQATFVGLDVPEAHGRWVDPGEEYNKIGYYRVFGSRLRWTTNGTAHTADVKSLISWRGEWYVVHLSAIR